jgi:trk system potassium uptake protein TrkH
MMVAMTIPHAVDQATKRVASLLRLPQIIPVTGFLAVILVGSLLLWLPWSHQSGAVHYLDALFTSTSAVCVTGLTTVNTATDYTVAGQVVIIVLIQIGGLGVMTYAAMAVTLLRRRMSLRARAALHDSFFQSDAARDFKRRFWQIISITLALEAVGTLVLFFALLPSTKSGSAAWSAVFHSVSAFCNAGFSILPNNLTDVRGNQLFMAAISTLIILGGLGFLVLHELFGELRRLIRRRERTRPRRLSLNTSVVLRVSLVLIVAGAGLVLLLGVTHGELTWGERITAGLFQSISARTAGFNTIDVGALPLASLMILAILMFIGGSPASCAGGMKTTSLAVLVARARSFLTGQEEARLLGRTLSRDVVRSAEMLFGLAFLWNLLGVILLAHFEMGRPEVQLHNLVFEQISAFGTVGLSTAATTAGLSVAGKIWIIATMYVGRLGPLTLVSLAVYRKPSRIGFPEGKVMVG